MRWERRSACPTVHRQSGCFYSAARVDLDVIAPAWLKGALLLGVTLMTGTLIGVTYERRRAPAHEGAGTHHVMHRLKDELGLDSVQH